MVNMIDSVLKAGLEMGVDEIDESEDENNEVLIDADDQGRINLYANYAMAWGPPRQGGPRGGRHYFSNQYQFGDCN